MEFSDGELMVMEMLWDGECLDENGEIQALELWKELNKKHGMAKTSCYTFLSRLLDKGAISRRYPKYTLKPIVTREEGLESERQVAIEKLFQGSLLNVAQTFLKTKEIDKDEAQAIKDLLDNF